MLYHCGPCRAICSHDCHRGHVSGRPATSVRQARHTQASLGPAEPSAGCNRFLLSSGCEWGRYYRVAHSTGLIPNENQISCRTLVACLALRPFVWSPNPAPSDPLPAQTKTCGGGGGAGASLHVMEDLYRLRLSCTAAFQDGHGGILLRGCPIGLEGKGAGVMPRMAAHVSVWRGSARVSVWASIPMPASRRGCSGKQRVDGRWGVERRALRGSRSQ